MINIISKIRVRIILIIFTIFSIFLMSCGSDSGSSTKDTVQPETGDTGYEIPAPVNEASSAGQEKQQESNSGKNYLPAHSNVVDSTINTGTNPGEIVLSCTLPDSSGIESVEIWRGKIPDITFTVSDDGTSENGQLEASLTASASQNISHTISDLLDGSRYSFIVRVKYSDGLYSTGIILRGQTISFESQRDMQIVVKPAGGITISWLGATGFGSTPSGYKLYRSDEPFNNGVSSTMVLVSEGTADVKSIEDTVPDTTNGMIYYYKAVYIYDDYDNHESAGSYGQINYNSVVTSPVELTSVRCLNGSITIDWKNPDIMTNNEIIVYKSLIENFTHTTLEKEIIYNGTGNSTGAIPVTKDIKYYYAVYVRDTAGNNFSSPIRITKTSWDMKPVQNSTIYGDLHRNNIFWDLPDGAVRTEIYYSSMWDLFSRHLSGRTLKGAADNWSIGSYIHSSSSDKDFSDGKHYYSIYAVYFDGVEFIRADRQDNLLAAYSLSQNDYDLWISQTSSVYPDEIETNGGEPNTYNWDQYIYISSNTYRHPGAVIRYTLDGSEPDVNSEEYTRPFIIPADGTLYTVKAALFNSDREKISETIQSQYKINYNAYNNNFKIIAKNGSTVLTTDDGNINYHSSQITNFHVEYKPVCGEVFSVYKKAVTGTIAASESLGGPSGYLSAFASVTPTILADNSVINNAVIENAHQTTAVTSWQIDDAVGKDNGGMMSRFAVRLSIAGRPSTVNNNLIDGENLKRADCTVVYPQLSITNLDMFERPLMTPYLWTKQEPVAVMNVKSKDFFTEDESFRNNIRVFFNVQYAAKNFPYGASGDTYGNPSSYNIRWQGTLSDPTGIEEIYSRSGNAIQLIKVDPLPKSLDADMPENWNGKKWYLNENNTYANYLRTITPSDGQLFHQIDNPYDSAKIGEKAHTDNIAAVGTLDEKAFRTVLRFRARAVEDGYRTSTVVKSFESTDASTFDTTTRDTISETGKPTVAGIPRFENGTSSKTSDFPLAYRSYPIEVCEHHEGWTTENRLSINWYEKHGIKYYGAGQGMTGITNAKNERDDSRFKNFNPNNKKLLVYVHGWQPTASYEIPGYEPGSGYMENISNPTDLASWKSIYGDPKVNPSTNYHQREWVADHWHAKGYNFAVFNWNRYSNSSRESTIGGISSGVQVPGPSESKVWFPTGGHGMAFFKENTVKKGAWSSVRDKAYSDSIRSANMGLVLAQDILDSIPEGIEPELFTIAAHSLGNNTAINATYKLYMKVRDNKLTMHRVPDRIDLLDPYYGTLTTGTDSDTNNTPGLTDALFEASYSCRYISGVTDSLYSDVLHHYAHIPIQWYRTSALTQPQTNSENDPNYRFFGRVNFQKMYFATGYWTKSGWNRSLDGGYIKVDEQSYTMAVAGIDTPHLNGDLHSEAHAWFFRSIQRNDSDASVVISASVPPAALWNRLNAYRFTNTDSPNVGYQWFEMQGHPDNDAHTGNQTVSVIDDEFIIRTGVQYGFNWMWSGLQKYASGSPGCMNY